MIITSPHMIMTMSINNLLPRYMRKMTSIMDSLKPVARIYWEVEEKVTFCQSLNENSQNFYEDNFTP